MDKGGLEVSEWAHACGQRWIRGIQRLVWGTGSRSNMGSGFHLRRMESLGMAGVVAASP